jgi:hypothetical protein
MHVIVDPNSVDLTSASRHASVRASNRLGFQKRGVETTVPTQPVTHDKAVFIWLILGAFSGLISATAAIFATVIDWKVLGWRNLCLAVCVAAFVGLITFISRACARF